MSATSLADIFPLLTLSLTFMISDCPAFVVVNAWYWVKHSFVEFQSLDSAFHHMGGSPNLNPTIAFSIVFIGGTISVGDVVKCHTRVRLLMHSVCCVNRIDGRPPRARVICTRADLPRTSPPSVHSWQMLGNDARDNGSVHSQVDKAHLKSARLLCKGVIHVFCFDAKASNSPL